MKLIFITFLIGRIGLEWAGVFLQLFMLCGLAAQAAEHGRYFADLVYFLCVGQKKHVTSVAQ